MTASTIRPASTYPVLEYDQAVPAAKSGGRSAISATSSRGGQDRNRSPLVELAFGRRRCSRARRCAVEQLAHRDLIAVRQDPGQPALDRVREGQPALAGQLE